MGQSCISSNIEDIKIPTPITLLNPTPENLLIKSNPKLFQIPFACSQPEFTLSSLPSFKLTVHSFSTLMQLGTFCETKDDLIYKVEVLVLEDGIYIGQTVNKERHGWGRMIWKDGSVFEGHWHEDIADGRGRIIHPSGDTYEGQWTAGRIEGYGRYTRFDGGFYEGDWCEDKQQGMGREVWPDGSTHEGVYQAGVKHGLGTFIWPDG